MRKTLKFSSCGGYKNHPGGALLFRRKGKGCWSRGERSTWSPMLIGDEKELAYVQVSQWSVKFHRTEWR